MLVPNSLQGRDSLRKRGAVVLSLLICAAVTAGCSKATNTNQTSANSQAQSNASSSNTATSPASNQGKGTAEDKGDFKLIFVPVKNEEKHAHLERLVKGSRLIEGMVDDLNKDIALPLDVPLKFTECAGLPGVETLGVENAWYNGETHEVTMCYELMAKSESLFKDDEKTQEELDEAVVGSTAWTLYHEIGHAMIDVLQINLTGKNEDAADQISTYILLDGTEDGEKAALSGAEDFYREAGEDNSLGETQFADTHSLSKQRFYNVTCWVYGTDPEKYGYLTQKYEGMGPRADYCKDEYETMVKSWQTHLNPYLKNR